MPVLKHGVKALKEKLCLLLFLLLLLLLIVVCNMMLYCWYFNLYRINWM